MTSSNEDLKIQFLKYLIKENETWLSYQNCNAPNAHVSLIVYTLIKPLKLINLMIGALP